MAKPTVFVTRKIAPEGLKILQEKTNVKIWDSEDACPRSELLKNVAGCDGILCTINDQIDAEVLNAAGKKLKVISTMSVGILHISTTECGKRGIQVTSTPDVASDSAAEFTVALTLVTTRRLLEGMDAVLKGEWGLWRPMWICGIEMVDRTIGIMGFGRVGFGVARRLKPFNVTKLIYHDLYRAGYADQVDAKLVTFDELVTQSDILIVCCAATPKTTKIFNKETFAKMKEGSIFINTSRGIVVDHDALAEAVQKGRPKRVGLDVTDPEPLPKDHPLMNNRKVIITPHIATNTWTTRINMAVNAANNLSAALCGF
ncbi:glyoxylate reductase/hydroxypyruvate reductase-like isoform X2 [Pomacea canaliculata]|uniref:glyoxylate reductase/hydroxypyruvate reductase-like isoform X2 n=1 Tax=Pomacea canaliculata TaxID=400727 RepID=UPI000D7355E6|nr:glyoxylate reductase/hydroxypyruvate reductase-like isoform X2 [Pomacea canaliculata]